MTSSQLDARQRLLEAAFALFTERGIDLTTTREIAAAAECNEITLFRHFGTKEGLARAVIEWYVPQQDSPQLDEAMRSGDLETDLRAATTLMLQFHRQRETFFKFIFANIVQHPEHQQFIQNIQQPFMEGLSRYFAPHLADTDLDVGTVVHDFVTPIAMRTMGRVFLGQEQLDEATFTNTHARLIAAGVLASKTT